jgi:predicted metal-dependent phosphoesterase TrpH
MRAPEQKQRGFFMREFESQVRTVDLHAHTTASDGDHSPTALVEHARQVGLTAIAVTDHDTTDGVAEALEAGERLGIEVIPGVELSAEPKSGQCHILGLLIDPHSKPLRTRLIEVRRNRNTRNARIVEKMQRELGWDITLEEVEEIAGGEVVARPHFARVLINKGYVQTMQQAFDEYLAKGAKAYVERDRLTSTEAIALIHQAGGVAILAHPNNCKLDPAATEQYIRELQSMGLDGIEARYNRHTPEDTSRYLTLARRLNLLTSGGSDFHGPSVKPQVYLGHVEHTRAEDLGQPNAALPAPSSLLDALKAAPRVMRSGV